MQLLHFSHVQRPLCMVCLDMIMYPYGKAVQGIHDTCSGACRWNEPFIAHENHIIYAVHLMSFTNTLDQTGHTPSPYYRSMHHTNHKHHTALFVLSIAATSCPCAPAPLACRASRGTSGSAVHCPHPAPPQKTGRSSSRSKGWTWPLAGCVA